MRVLVVDSHPVVCGAVCAFLESQGMQIVGHATTAHRALELAQRVEFDVMVMDVVIGRHSGVRLLRRLIQSRRVVAVAFSGDDSDESIAAFMRAGGAGFVSKQSSMSELLVAIRMASEGQEYVARGGRSRNGVHPERAAHGLSAREVEVTACIAAGLTSKEIAEKLFVSVNTVQTHRRRIFSKFGVHSVAELIKTAIDHGVLMRSEIEPGRSARNTRQAE